MVPRTCSLALLSIVLPILATACASLGAAGAPQASSAVQVVAVGRVSAPTLMTLSAAEADSSPTVDDGRAPGDLVEVEWRGSWWPAVLVERRGGLWLIHYEAYGGEWDEPVGPDRIRPRKPSADGEEPEDETDP